MQLKLKGFFRRFKNEGLQGNNLHLINSSCANLDRIAHVESMKGMRYTCKYYEGDEKVKSVSCGLCAGCMSYYKWEKMGK
jgi:hypothetical protein